MFAVEADQESKDDGEGGLECTVVGKGSSGNDEEVEKKTECRETNDNAGNDPVDGEEVAGEGVAKEEESRLEHDEAKPPGDHPIHLPLPLSAAINDGSMLH